jgi:WD40 repeat protein
MGNCQSGNSTKHVRVGEELRPRSTVGSSVRHASPTPSRPVAADGTDLPISPDNEPLESALENKILEHWADETTQSSTTEPGYDEVEDVLILTRTAAGMASRSPTRPTADADPDNGAGSHLRLSPPRESVPHGAVLSTTGDPATTTTLTSVTAIPITPDTPGDDRDDRNTLLQMPQQQHPSYYEDDDQSIEVVSVASGASSSRQRHTAGRLLVSPPTLPSPRQRQPEVLYDMAPAKPSRPPTPSRQRLRRGGRAYQARVEKARYLQMKLNQSGGSGTGPTSGANALRALSPFGESIAGMSILEDEELSCTDHSARSRYSLNTSSLLAASNELFNATTSRGVLWAAAATQDHTPVTTVTWSRCSPTLQCAAPPLYVAFGTEAGLVQVQEARTTPPVPSSLVLSRDPKHQGTATSKNNTSKLGPVVAVTRGSRTRSIDFSRNGQYLAVGGDDCICAVYRVIHEPTPDDPDGESKLRLVPLVEISRVDRVYAVQFRPDGKYLAIGGFDGTVAIVATSNWEVTAEIARDGLVLCLDWSPDGKLLALGASDKSCAIVHADSSWNIRTEFHRPADVVAVKWHPNGRLLAVGSSDVAIVEAHSWITRHEIDTKPTAGSPLRRSVYKAHALCWSPNGSYLMFAGTNGTRCVLLETKSFTMLHEIQRDEVVTSVAWGEQIVREGIPRRFMAIGSEDGSVAIMQAGLETRSGASTVGDDVSSMSQMSNASSYFSTRGEWELREDVFDDIEGELVDAPDNRAKAQSGTCVRALAFSRGSKSRPSAYFAVATDDCVVTVRSTVGWKVVSRAEFAHPIRCLAFSNGSRFLALGGEDAKLSILATVPSWTVVTDFSFAAPLTCLSFSKNNERLVVGSLDGTLTFLDPRKNWQVVGEIHDNESPVLSLDWSTQNLVIGRHDGSVQIYDSVQILRNSLKPSKQLDVSAPARALAFGVNSRFLVVGGGNGVVNVYSSKGGWVLCHQISEGDVGIAMLRWSPTGRFLAYTGESRLFKVVDTVFWADVEEADEMMAIAKSVPREQEDKSPALAFSQDGNLIACGANVFDCRRWESVFALQQKKKVGPHKTGSKSDGEHSSLSSREEQSNVMVIAEE